MTDNAIRSRRMSGISRASQPVQYVDNYDAMSGRMHPSARAAMDPTVDMLERSQVMRGARQTGPEWEENDAISAVEEAAASVGYKLPERPTAQDLAAMLEAAAKTDLGATDGGIATIVRLAKTYGIQSPFGDPSQNSRGGDYVFGGQRPTNLQMNPEIPADGDQGPMPYRVKPRPGY